MNIILAILESVRVKQWVKNLFVFLPLVFGGKVFDPADLKNVIITFAIFCLASGGVYLFNDLIDKKRDRFHPLKSKRPIASGRLHAALGAVLSCGLTVLALGWALAFDYKIFIVAICYVLVHIVYTIFLKRVVIVDVMIIAFGFELRIWAGALACYISPSIWLQLCVFLLAMFLGFIKRRHEKASLLKDAPEHRGVLSNYKIYFLDQLIVISATLCIVFYGLYTVFATQLDNHMAYTIPFVVCGIYRYLYMVHVQRMGGDPSEIVITDIPLITIMCLWFFSVVYFIYLHTP
ncbi:MAG: decaprenyl-phosphate phosphoribosyltransferase [Candidatus Omnitrophica bacterium]|nr:decaprenyl-phosphate phosphoribosyltransferase [Candidatus Omnitrophota bacterium]